MSENTKKMHLCKPPMGQCPFIPLGPCGPLDLKLIWKCPLFSVFTFGNPMLAA